VGRDAAAALPSVADVLRVRTLTAAATRRHIRCGLREVEARERAADLDEMTQDAVDLRGISDDGEDSHVVAEDSTDERILAPHS
jgi:hypothetical protein